LGGDVAAKENITVTLSWKVEGNLPRKIKSNIGWLIYAAFPNTLLYNSLFAKR